MKSFYSLVIFTVLSFGLSIGARDLRHPVSQKIQPRAIASIETKLSETKPGAEAQDATLDESCGPYEIMNETFEASWPTSLWNVVDLSNDGYDRKWDDDNYRPHSGNLAAWPARGGVNGRDPIATNNDYFNNMNTRMIYGPFDLSDAFQADISFWMWRQMESCCDYLVLEVSGDNGTFQEVGRWTGNAGWEQQSISLNAYIGDSTVWVAWRFYSDRRNVFDGPWVDDIMLRKYVAGTVTVSGTLSYIDRYTNTVGAPFTTVKLYDQDIGGYDDPYGITHTIDSGFFQFSDIWNYDEDASGLDLYVIFEADYNDTDVARRRVVNLSDDLYQWTSSVQDNVPDGDVVFDYVIQTYDPAKRAMWIFQDLRRAWEHVFNNTNPPVDPGSVTAKWELYATCYPWGLCSSYFNGGVGGPYIFISDEQVISSDTVVHETGHHYMWNMTGWWWWDDPGCWQHDIFTQEDVWCAWSEGWADFFPLFTNEDECYDKGIGPCTGAPDIDTFDLEAHGIGDGKPEGDLVEGRVAGSLFDLIDSASDGYDSANFSFDPISRVVFEPPETIWFYGFWERWMASGYNAHHAVRAIYQNTIDFDSPPSFTPEITEVFTLEGVPTRIDLHAHSDDEESELDELAYSIPYVSTWECGIALDVMHNYLVNIDPHPGWTGYCDATAVVSDSIKTASDDFRVYVLPVDMQAYLTLVYK
ncbi:MAG: hypothetical protein A2136_03005 [Chloroflexi bacterium RBG_16_54_11]|nr:MAG: hypothetical protein A2136_03005 [Chloroflexi bacterium RBG_16_54_11]